MGLTLGALAAALLQPKAPVGMSHPLPKKALMEAEGAIQQCFASLTAADAQESVATLTNSLNQLRALQEYFVTVQAEAPTAASVEEDVAELRNDIFTKQQLIDSKRSKMAEWLKVFDKL